MVVADEGLNLSLDIVSPSRRLDIRPSAVLKVNNTSYDAFASKDIGDTRKYIQLTTNLAYPWFKLSINKHGKAAANN